jgi:hypothetical protein
MVAATAGVITLAESGSFSGAAGKLSAWGVARLRAGATAGGLDGAAARLLAWAVATLPTGSAMG